MHPTQWNWTKIGLFFAFLPIIAIAGYVSFGHIYDVVHQHGQNGITAFLTPFSVDGLITVGYLKNRVVMGYVSTWRRIWCPIAIYGGLAVSLAANMESSHFTDPISTAVAGWPAIALFISLKALGIKMPKLSDAMHAMTEVAKAVKPVKSVQAALTAVAPVKAQTPAKATKASTPRKRTPAKKATRADGIFQAAVIDPVAVELS